MNAYNFKIDLACPQCGAPAVLDETEYIIRCEFCRTGNIIHTHPYPCFFISPKKHRHAHLPVTYVPYWRFKGLEFSLGPRAPGFRVIDHSYIAVERPGLPASLGLRSQTQKLQFIQKGIIGAFLPPDISRKNILDQIAGQEVKKVHIGEILSLIFMPFHHDTDIIYDGLTGKITGMKQDLSSDKKAPSYHLTFTPSLCPNCGWDLRGETDSLVLSCKNCLSFWLIHNKKLNRVQAQFFGLSHDTSMVMPFWQFRIKFDTLDLHTYADLIRVANIPKVPRPDHEKQAVYFYVPAFKVSPKLFLRIGKQITLAQIQAEERNRMPDVAYHPADLSLDEGLQAVPPILMDVSTNKKDIWALLAGEKLTVRSFSLAYMGFRASGSEYIQDDLGVSLQINSLKFGRRL